MASPNHSSQAIVATLLPSNEILELLTVSFPSQSATHTFAVKMFLSDNEDLPMRLWLESNDTKHQWECLVLDTQNHVPKGAKYVLPWDSVVSSLKSGLEHLASHATCECDYVVTLEDGDSGHLRLALVLPYARSYYATYSFDLVPMAIEKVDIVHAQLRDVQAQLRVVQDQLRDALIEKPSMAATNNLLNAAALNDPLYASLKSMSTASPETFLTWKQIGATAGRRHSQISLLADAATISLAQPGLYHIQARGVIDASDIGSGLRLIVGSTS
ncbi:hypothetical protein As57867_007520, partial [Aphanomyces stellatus]